MNKSSLLIKTLGTFIFLSIAIGGFAQSTDKFKIQVSMEGDKMLLECTEGCVWTNLEFQLEEGGQPQFINEYGVALKDEPQRTHEDIPSFLFSFKRNGEKINCSSEYGTNWENLSFNCNAKKCKATISEKGVRG